MIEKRDFEKDTAFLRVGRYAWLGLFPVLLLVLAAPPAVAQETTDSAAAQDGRWTVERAQQWQAEHDWVVGANFVPSTAVNPIDMWQEFTFDPETIDRELGYAADAGFNTMRVFLHYLVWARSPQDYKERIDRYLDIADRHDIKTIFVLFDDVWGDDPTLGKQPRPVPGVHNSGWVENPGHDQRLDEALWPVLTAYTRDIVSAFGDDERVLMWDLYNQPGNGKRPPTSSLPLLRRVVGAARAAAPSQPLTIPLWNFTDRFEELREYQRVHSDIITFHDYDSLAETKRIVANLRQKIDGRPLLNTEYMARTNGNTFESHLPYFHERNIGAVNWGLVKGETNTIYPWEYPKGTDRGYYNRWKKAVREVYPWEDPEDVPEPETWFHDVFRQDGTPYDMEEVGLIRRLSSQEAGRTDSGERGQD